MSRNFLISYSGRVGSTALIDTLKLIPGFLVPVFEELDYYAIDQAGQLDKHNEDNIHSYVDYIYRDSSKPDLSVGFKWRMWGDLDRIAEVLNSHDVVVFNLIRADLFEYVSSIYLSDIVNKDFNSPQFLLRDAETDDDREKILSKYRTATHDLDIERFFALLDEQVSTERARFEQLDHLGALGCEIVTIFYEDFAYKRFGFLNKLLHFLKHDPLSFIPVTSLKKVSGAYPSERFNNREELLSSPRLLAALGDWDFSAAHFEKFL